MQMLKHDYIIDYTLQTDTTDRRHRHVSVSLSVIQYYTGSGSVVVRWGVGCLNTVVLYRGVTSPR